MRDYLASQADAQTVRLTVIASTIATYLEVVATRRQLGNTEENVGLLRERSELTEGRYRAGLATSFIVTRLIRLPTMRSQAQAATVVRRVWRGFRDE